MSEEGIDVLINILQNIAMICINRFKDEDVQPVASKPEAKEIGQEATWKGIALAAINSMKMGGLHREAEALEAQVKEAEALGETADTDCIQQKIRDRALAGIMAVASDTEH